MSIIHTDHLAKGLTPVSAGIAGSSSNRVSLRRWIRRVVVGDLAAACLASFLALLIRFGWSGQQQGHISYVLVGAVATLAWPVLLAVSGAYELRPSMFGVEELRRVLRAGVLLTATAGMTHLTLRLDLSRGYLVAVLFLAVSTTMWWRVSLRSIRNRSSNPTDKHRVVAVGAASDIARLYRDVTVRRAPVEIVAAVLDDLDEHDPVPDLLRTVHRLPNRDAIGSLATNGFPIDLLVRAGHPGPDEMWALGRRAHDLGVAVAIAPDRKDAAASLSLTYLPLGSTPLLLVETPTLRPVAAITKSLMDRCMALSLLILMAPILGAIAAYIRVREGGQVMFRQARVGRYGQIFTCLKFRTMTSDAEARLDDLLAINDGSGPLFKLRDDPRVTPTGRWLRRHSLDELPQLWNVLRGEMSIVGPRPPLPGEVATYDTRTGRRLLVRPGMTGLWQTEGRSELPWDDGVYLDLMYIDHWSPLLDLVIMARTVRSVVRPQGAY